MIDTVLFDMGGTLEDIFVDEESRQAASREVVRILQKNGIRVTADERAAAEMLAAGWDRYAAYRDPVPAGAEAGGDLGRLCADGTSASAADTVEPFAEELAHMWEVTHYHRSLRPRVPEMLEGLKGLGMKLGVISNTASLFQVYEILEEYGIRDYFQDVTLSSVTGYRKPHANIFKVSLYQMQSRAGSCAYVGDTFSRDVIGPQNAGFGMTFHIHSFLTASKDADVPPDVRATYSIGDIYQVYEILRDLRGGSSIRMLRTEPCSREHAE